MYNRDNIFSTLMNEIRTDQIGHLTPAVPRPCLGQTGRGPGRPAPPTPYPDIPPLQSPERIERLEHLTVAIPARLPIVRVSENKNHSKGVEEHTTTPSSIHQQQAV